MELFEAIRRDARRDEVSIRGLADRYGVHRRTVRAALASAVPAERKVAVRVAPRLDPARELIDAMLREDLTAPRKQRHTARRILARLVDEHGLGEITYSTVRDYVQVRRPRILAEAGRSLDEAFVVQVHAPGAEAEVDFADVWVILAGVRTKLFLFTLRLSFSGKAIHRVFNSQCQESFLEAHVQAFTALGGVPFDKIRYDNLKAAVSRVLFGRDRIESARWVMFRSHMGFDTFYCKPGIEGAHEKGGVEGEGGRFRRNHLVPMPVVDSVGELNERLKAYDLADDCRRIGNRSNTVGMDFEIERGLLGPLPVEAFETGITLNPRVDRFGRVTVRQCHYSVPAGLIGGRVRVLLRADEVLVFDRARLVASHARARTRGDQVLVLDHYLEVLVRKPGAMPGAMALAQARTSGVFTGVHDRFWAGARAGREDSAAIRILIEVLLLHRLLPSAAVIAGMEAALAIGAFDPQLVAVEARRAAARQRGQELNQPTSLDTAAEADGDGVGARRARVIVLPTAVTLAVQAGLDGGPVAGVRTDLPGERPLPSVAHYDELLSRRTKRDQSTA